MVFFSVGWSVPDAWTKKQNKTTDTTWCADLPSCPVGYKQACRRKSQIARAVVEALALGRGDDGKPSESLDYLRYWTEANNFVITRVLPLKQGARNLPEYTFPTIKAHAMVGRTREFEHWACPFPVGSNTWQTRDSCRPFKPLFDHFSIYFCGFFIELRDI